VRIGQLQDRATGPNLVRNSVTSTCEVLYIFGRDFIRDGFYFRGRDQTIDPDYIIPSPFPPPPLAFLMPGGTNPNLAGWATKLAWCILIFFFGFETQCLLPVTWLSLFIAVEKLRGSNTLICRVNHFSVHHFQFHNSRDPSLGPTKHKRLFCKQICTCPKLQTYSHDSQPVDGKF